MRVSLEHGQFGWDFIIKAEDGRSILVQSDWEYPSLACLFGAGEVDPLYEPGEPTFTLKTVQKPPVEDQKTNFGRPLLEREPEFEDCEHSRTDGTINCPDCGVTASEFIVAAHNWLAENEGAEVEDPGYFTGDK